MSVFAHSSVGGLVHLEQLGVQQQSVGSLRVVVALFVEVAQFVQVPSRKKSRDVGGYRRFAMLDVINFEPEIKQNRNGYTLVFI